jgi:hypothetical protein
VIDHVRSGFWQVSTCIDVSNGNIVRWVFEPAPRQLVDNQEQPARLFEDLMEGVEYEHGVCVKVSQCKPFSEGDPSECAYLGPRTVNVGWSEGISKNKFMLTRDKKVSRLCIPFLLVSWHRRYNPHNPFHFRET